MALTTSGISILDTTSKLLSGMVYSGSCDSGAPTSNPSTEVDRMRRGVTRRTGCTLTGEGAAGLGGLGGSGGARATGGAGEGAGAGAGASVLLLLSTASTRPVISSTIAPIDASS